MIELSARECRARVHEFNLTDHALVAFAACNPKGRASGINACSGGREGVASRREAVVGLLHFESDLLCYFFLPSTSWRSAARASRTRAASAPASKSFQVKSSDAVAKL